jgi:hypothetical protein
MTMLELSMYVAISFAALNPVAAAAAVVVVADDGGLSLMDETTHVCACVPLDLTAAMIFVVHVASTKCKHRQLVAVGISIQMPASIRPDYMMPIPARTRKMDVLFWLRYQPTT